MARKFFKKIEKNFLKKARHPYTPTTQPNPHTSHPTHTQTPQPNTHTQPDIGSVWLSSPPFWWSCFCCVVFAWSPPLVVLRVPFSCRVVLPSLGGAPFLLLFCPPLSPFCPSPLPLPLPPPPHRPPLERKVHAGGRRRSCTKGGREGARRIHIAGDFNIELGLLYTGEDDDEEVPETMWYEVMKEFTCEAVSTRSSCDDPKEKAFHTQSQADKRRNVSTGRHPGGNKKKVRAQRRYITRSSGAVRGTIYLVNATDTRK